jgi:hypothetical protein
MVALCMVIMQLHTWYLDISGFYKWQAYAVLIKNIASKHVAKPNNGQRYTYHFSLRGGEEQGYYQK